MTQAPWATSEKVMDVGPNSRVGTITGSIIASLFEDPLGSGSNDIPGNRNGELNPTGR